MFTLAAPIMALGPNLAQAGAPAMLTYEGYLTDSSSGTETPVSGTRSMAVRILGRNSADGSCLLYSEQHVSVPVAEGHFHLFVGQGVSPSFPGGQTSLKEIFNNRQTLIGPSCQFDPSRSDSVRLLRIELTNPAVVLGDVTLTDAPRAFQADNALSLDGRAAADFVQTASLPAPCAANEFLSWNGAGFSCMTPASGGGGAGLQTLNGLANSSQVFAVGSVGLTPGWQSSGNVHTLNIPSASGAGVQAGTISKADFDMFSNKLDATTLLAGDVGGTFLTTRLADGSVRSATIANGSVSPSHLSFAASLPANDGLIVKSASQFSNLSCAAGQTITWNAPSGWGCATALTAESDPKIQVGANNALAKWNGTMLVASALFDVGGNIGIGTTAPGAPLDVNGTVRAASFAGAGSTLTSLNGSAIASGTVPAARLGAGTPSATTYLRGDGTWQAFPVGLAPTGTAGGDLTGNYPNPTLAPSGVTAGTYRSVTVDGKGRVTAGTNPSTLGEYGITDAVSRSGDTINGALTVNGLIRGKSAILVASTVIDFSTGNIQFTNGSCGNFQFNNLKDGATYMFVVKGSTSATCNFTAYLDAGFTALTVHMPPNNGATTASKHTIYNFAVAGNDVYVAWTPGY